MTSASTRTSLKHHAEPLLASLAWSIRPKSVRSGCVVLAYHNVRPAGEAAAGERALHIPWNQFCQHLDLIQGCAEVISLERTRRRAVPEQKLRVALTFDDAYAAAVEMALPELSRRGLPATMFVAPGLLEGRSFWWDQLAHAQNGDLAGSVRHQAMTTAAGQTARVFAWALQQQLPWTEAMPAWATGASITSLRQAASLPGISIGAHSWSHPNMTAIDRSTLDHELRTPRAWLKEHGLGSPEWLAYPYGLANMETAAAAAAAGYTGALRVSGGFLTGVDTHFDVPRLNVPADLTAAGLKLRLSGWLTE